MPKGAPNLEYGRLGILAAAIIVVLLLGYLLVRLLSGGGGIPASQQYFNDLRPIIRSSNATGNDFHQLMIKRGVPVNQFVSQLTQQMNTSQDVVNKAAALKPPKELQPVQPFLLQALQYRVNGLRCLIKNAPAAYKAASQTAAGAPMALCTHKLLASDTIYADSFAGASTSILKQHNTVAQPPNSQFLATSDTNLVLAADFGAAIERLRGKVQPGLHGTSVGRIVVQPKGTVLKGAGPTEVKESSDMSFDVTVINKGNFQEVSIPVTFKLAHSGAKTLTKTQTIASIDPGQKTVVSFGQLFNATNRPVYNLPYTITVNVQKVPGEVNVTNNSRTTKVILLAP